MHQSPDVKKEKSFKKGFSGKILKDAKKDKTKTTIFA
jgi:hypothetical protein